MDFDKHILMWPPPHLTYRTVSSCKEISSRCPFAASQPSLTSPGQKTDLFFTSAVVLFPECHISSLWGYFHSFSKMYFEIHLCYAYMYNFIGQCYFIRWMYHNLFTHEVIKGLNVSSFSSSQ